MIINIWLAKLLYKKILKNLFIRLRAENHGCKPLDECEQPALRRMSPSDTEGEPAEAKRRRVNIGTTVVKPWGLYYYNKKESPCKLKTILAGAFQWADDLVS